MTDGTNLTPADIAAIGGNGGNMWGGDSAWFIIILFLFAFLGFGNGNGFGANSGAANNYVLASDFATLQRQLDSSTDRLAQQGNQIANGLCDGFYTQAQLINGVNANITQAQIAGMQNTNALSAAISGVNYNMAMNANATQNAITSGFCQTNYNNQTNTRDVIDNANSNTRAILDALNAQQIAAKDAKIAEQNRQISALQLAASQAAQNDYLVARLQPTPVPSYPASNLYGYMNCCNCN